MVDTPRIVALTGNPRPGSRTKIVADRVAERLARPLGLGAPVSLDLAEIADQLLVAPAPEADRYREVVTGAGLLVVATPVYKASYTGLLKAFADRVPTGGLQGVVAVPVTVSASPAHTFVAEHLLRPLLVELGCSVPASPLALTEAQLADLDAVLEGWLEPAVELLGRVLGRSGTGDD